jgi:ABC-type bacteriocin/lantibiotic exporter with double-glycine peptidase domain
MGIYLRKILINIAAILTRHERKNAILLVILNLIVSVLDIFSIATILFIINFYTISNSQVKSRYLPGWLADHHSLLLILLFFLFFLIKSIGGFLIFQSQSRFVYKVATRISQSSLLRYLEGSYANYTLPDSSVLIRKISQQPTEFCHYVLAGIQQIITESILIVLTILVIFLFNAKLFLFLFVILLPAIIIMSYFTKTKLRTVRAHIKTNSEKALQYLHEALSGFIESNIYNKNNFFIDRFINFQEVQNKFLADLVVTQGVSSRLIEVFAVLGLFILIAANHWLGGDHAVELVTIGAFIGAAYKIIPGIVKILNTSGQIRTYEFTMYDLLELPKNPSHVRVDSSDSGIDAIAFDQVCFSYENLSLIHNINLQIAAGDFIGISGLSGKGKTTLINLLLGFLEPESGHISINHIRQNALGRQGYWRHIAYVKQQAFLLYDTISNNITLAKDQFDEPRLKQAVQSTGLESLLGPFPAGIQKIITENGKNISGGQRQRITIARALYKDADLIILDEPFNELDELSERSMLSHFKELTGKGKMVILITHNPESFSYCTKIVTLNEQ